MNLYATPFEIKQAMPDGIQPTNDAYDSLLYRLSERISRMIDRYCFRYFYPKVETRYYNGDGGYELWVKDLLEITTMYYSTDNGRTYTAYSANDYILTVAGDANGRGSYTLIVGNLNSNAVTGYFPAGQRSVKIIGIFGCTDDRDVMWESSGDTTENNPLTAAGSSITVNDADGEDQSGFAPRFQAGQLLKIGSELIQCYEVSETGNMLAVLRGRNGSTAAIQAQNTAISIWRPPADVKQAGIIQAVRALQRGFQGFADTRANPDIGQLMQVKALDPEAQMYLEPFVWYGD